MITRMTKITILIILGLYSTFNAASETSHKNTLEQIEFSRLIKQGQAKQLVEQQLPLTKEQKALFWPIYEEYKKEMGILNSRLLAIITQYAKSYNADNFDNIKGLKLLEKSFIIDEDRIKIKRKYLQIFNKQLPAKVVARFFHIDNKIEALIKYGISKQVPLIPIK